MCDPGRRTLRSSRTLRSRFSVPRSPAPAALAWRSTSRAASSTLHEPHINPVSARAELHGPSKTRILLCTQAVGGVTFSEQSVWKQRQRSQALICSQASSTLLRLANLANEDGWRPGLQGGQVDKRVLWPLCTSAIPIKYSSSSEHVTFQAMQQSYLPKFWSWRGLMAT